MRNTTCQYLTSTEGSGFEYVSNINEPGPTIAEQELGGTGFQTALPVEQAPSTVSQCLSSIFSSDQDSFLDSSLITFGDRDENLASTGTFGRVDQPNTLDLLPSSATTPRLVRHSMELILRILRTWPRMLAKDIQLPPIIHATQVSEQFKTGTIANCITLAKMWHGQCLGAAEIVQDTVKREMQDLINTVIPPQLVNACMPLMFF